ncbi:MAG: helix-turn-helix transcriptional regulator [Deltaproteobacteria bacterium]|nr:helix-turn-helix transcriptional regulator [Deltaproteobacteria bacterium]
MSRRRHPSRGKKERYIQPSILLSLHGGPTYGYEVIRTIHQFGFLEGSAPPGMIYRHLRQLEEDGLVSSQWDTKGAGPAKRIYQLTLDGEEMLVQWIDYMESQAKNLMSFIETYRRMT